MTDALRATELGKRFGDVWAVRSCTVATPAGRIVALVGPNGAGKTTLLQLAAGLLTPTTGTIRVLGEEPASTEATLARVGFVAQGTSLYPNFTGEDLLAFGRHMNLVWDEASARDHLRRLQIPLERRSSTLSTGQRAQLALVLALAKRPNLLLLDEPLANVDPLARRELLGTLMASVADSGTTIVLSSHLIADLERVCDHLIILTHGQVALDGPIERLLEMHKAITGPSDAGMPPVDRIIEMTTAGRQSTFIAETSRSIIDPKWEVQNVSLEDLVLAYLGRGPTSDHMAAPEIEVTR